MFKLLLLSVVLGFSLNSQANEAVDICIDGQFSSIIVKLAGMHTEEEVLAKMATGDVTQADVRAVFSATFEEKMSEYAKPYGEVVENQGRKTIQVTDQTIKDLLAPFCERVAALISSNDSSLLEDPVYLILANQKEKIQEGIQSDLDEVAALEAQIQAIKDKIQPELDKIAAIEKHLETKFGGPDLTEEEQKAKISELVTDPEVLEMMKQTNVKLEEILSASIGRKVVLVPVESKDLSKSEQQVQNPNPNPEKEPVEVTPEEIESSGEEANSGEDSVDSSELPSKDEELSLTERLRKQASEGN